MRELPTRLLLGCLVVMAACNRADTPPDGETQEPIIVSFDSYAEAQAVRANLEAAGAEVSERIKLVDGEWTFESSLPYEPPAEEITGECRSSGTGRWGPGKTVCDLRSDAARERELMVSDGWECTDVVKTETGDAWEFEWVKHSQA